MVERSVGVGVPSEDPAEGRATRIALMDPGDMRRMPLLQICSGTQRPADALAAVRYGRSWFWVDDRDLSSKHVFMFLRMFASLAETGVVPQAALADARSHSQRSDRPDDRNVDNTKIT